METRPPLSPQSRVNGCRISLLLALVGTSGAAAQTASFDPVGDLSGGAVGSIATAVSGDGITVTGHSWSTASAAIGSTKAEVFTWTKSGGIAATGTIVSDGRLRAVSDMFDLSSSLPAPSAVPDLFAALVTGWDTVSSIQPELFTAFVEAADSGLALSSLPDVFSAFAIADQAGAAASAQPGMLAAFAAVDLSGVAASAMPPLLSAFVHADVTSAAAYSAVPAVQAAFASVDMTGVAPSSQPELFGAFAAVAPGSVDLSSVPDLFAVFSGSTPISIAPSAEPTLFAAFNDEADTLGIDSNGREALYSAFASAVRATLSAAGTEALFVASAEADQQGITVSVQPELFGALAASDRLGLAPSSVPDLLSAFAAADAAGAAPSSQPDMFAALASADLTGVAASSLPDLFTAFAEPDYSAAAVSSLPDQFAGFAYTVDDDGLQIVGHGAADGGPVTTAFIWDGDGGLRSLREALADLSVSTSGWTLSHTCGTTGDGRVVAGSGLDPNSNVSGWRIVLPPRSPISDINKDGVVDINDYAAFMSAYQAKGSEADVTLNGAVESDDLLLFQADYLSP